MKKLKFVAGPLPKGFKPDFESFLFNEERHRLLQSAESWQSFSLVHEDKKKAVASISLCLDKKTAMSPFQAPFGSIEFSNSLQPADLFEFLKQVEQELKTRGVSKILLKNPPEAYQSSVSSLLEVLLLNLGYRILTAEISACIVINEKKYDQKIDGWELRKIKQGIKAKLRFRELSTSSLDEVYSFLLACREERHQSLSMTLAQLTKAVKALPGNFILFGVYQGETLAAASISILVSKRIIYNFYSGHPRSQDSLSPVVSLIKGLYGWGQKRGIELIDLGTSAFEGLPNFSLLDFKLRLGGIPSTKFTFEKDLD